MSKLKKLEEIIDDIAPVALFAFLAIMGVTVTVMAIWGVITYPKREVIKAQCNSIEGAYYGGGKCYKDGKEITNE